MQRNFPQAELRALTSAEPTRWEHVVGRGYGTNTAKWRVSLDDGRSVFVKKALDEHASGWLRREHEIYSSVTGTFMPEFIGWHDDVGSTILALEDLSEAHWPPPWAADDVTAVRSALDAVHATPPPAGLQPLEDLRESLEGWRRVASDPEPFLSVGVCSREWLEAALPALRRASALAELRGDAFLHLDVRSDNLCLRNGQAILVDWNWACVGNPVFDVVFWLPSLRLEGGPEPWEHVDDSGGLSALMAGFFASVAGLPAPATAPRVREFQRRQAEVALLWVVRELGLPPLTLSS